MEFQPNHTGNLAEGCSGILQLPIFTGSHLNPKFSHNEYYKVNVIDSSYSENDNNKHWFKLQVTEVLSGTAKVVGSKFRKQGKNFYANFQQLTDVPEQALKRKQQQKECMLER